jgi:hypothetical protein
VTAQQLQLFKALQSPDAPNKNEWFTPARYMIAVREALGGIDLDVASCAKANEVVQAARFHTKDDDGLAQTWHGKVFMNCPYSPTPQPWTKKFVAEYHAGHMSAGIALVPPKIDTAWFAPLFEGLICWADHRIQFWGQVGSSNTFGSAFVYFGSEPDRFARAFDLIGEVTQRYRAVCS